MRTPYRKISLWCFYLSLIVFYTAIPSISNQGIGIVKREYSWNDFDGIRRTVTFSIRSSDITESEHEYGAPPTEIGSQRITFHYKISYPANATPEIIRKLKENAKANSERQARAIIDAQRSRVFSRGYIAIDGDKIGVDLAGAWNRNRQRMRAYVQQFAYQTGITPNMLPSQALAFVQQIEYKKPPDLRAGSCILQFYPPVEALNARYGDCDTKAILFASMVDNGNGPEVIALRGPDHVIAAVECKPDTPGYVIRVFNKSFLLCECSAPSWPPGSISQTTYKTIAHGDYIPVRLRPYSSYCKSE